MSFASIPLSFLSALSLFSLISTLSEIRAHNEALHATADRDLEESAFYGPFVVIEP